MANQDSGAHLTQHRVQRPDELHICLQKWHLSIDRCHFLIIKAVLTFIYSLEVSLTSGYLSLNQRSAN